ncbi:MAG TPA: isoprenylcysteine carboxylmethyltransferase family protein [Acidobacteriaceae bacterium]
MAIAWQILYWSWVLSEVWIALATRTRSGKGEVHDRGSFRLLWIVNVSSLVTGVWFGEASLIGRILNAQWMRSGGLVIMIVGLVLRWSAVISLGKAFSSNVAIRESQQVRTDGLYRWMRHPSYAGLILLFLAVGVHARNWIAFLIVTVPTTAAVLYRIHVEESALKEHFGLEYIEYSKKTRRLIPGVY